ncbi:MAG: DOMON-like domain-containing protein [Azoarcus sp.]|nr:DOMON-like domain-containing protein [Azoarcus sp.]
MTSSPPPAPKIPTITVGLRPFDPAQPSAGGGLPAVSALLATCSARPDGGARFVFALEGRLDALRLPAADAPCSDPLWRHTCFEAFLAAPGEDGYREYNFSPAGPWATSRFRRYREIEDSPVDAAAQAPVLTADRRDGVLTLEVDLPSALLPPCPVLRVGLAAVIEHDDGRLEYWAIHHPAGQPDFHHADGWLLELDTRLVAQ